MMEIYALLDFHFTFLFALTSASLNNEGAYFWIIVSYYRYGNACYICLLKLRVLVRYTKIVHEMDLHVI